MVWRRRVGRREVATPGLAAAVVKPMQTTSTDYRKDCLSCHQPAKSTDWMCSLGYPALQR